MHLFGYNDNLYNNIIRMTCILCFTVYIIIFYNNHDDDNYNNLIN